MRACPFGDYGGFDIIVNGDAEQFDPLRLPAGVTGVLGAGNSDSCNDIIDPMVKLNNVVVYKSNPVMSKGAEVKRRIFKPLIAKGYLAMFHGSVDQGRMVAQSSKVTQLICTGSHLTYDRIVWGSQDKNDPNAQKILDKPFIAELGSVNPYIVVPGDSMWSQSDIDSQAAALVAFKMVNNAHVCAAPQVLLTCKNWSQREAFLEAVRREVRDHPGTRCFYPGVRQTYDKHKLALGGQGVTMQQAVSLGFGKDAETPLLFKSGLSSTEMSLALKEEAFCPILVEVPIDSEAILESFLPAAVDFAQEALWGSLTCTVIVDDATKARPAARQALDETIDRMRFGTIGINVPASIANGLPQLSWGAFPGQATERDVQSGFGHLGNFHCYKNLQKTLLEGRFRNLLQFNSKGSPAYNRKRGRRMADLVALNSYVAAVRFAKAHFIGPLRRSPCGVEMDRLERSQLSSRHTLLGSPSLPLPANLYPSDNKAEPTSAE